jgi:RNA polymerase sigma factor (sigma-70 family)
MAGFGMVFHAMTGPFPKLSMGVTSDTTMARLNDREDAFRRIYGAYYRQVSAYARRRLNEGDADDATAETFLVAWRRVEDIPEGDLTLPWLYGVARRVVSQGRRSGRRRAQLLARLSRFGSHDEVVVSEAETLSERETVHLALARLRPIDREILRLAEWDGLRPAQLAQIFNCSTNAATIRLHRAHRRFGRALEALEGKGESSRQLDGSK